MSIVRSAVLLLVLTAWACCQEPIAERWFLLQKVDGTAHPRQLQHPKIDGISIRVRWSTLEPRDDEFDWAYLDLQINRARERGLPYMLRVMAGTSAPQHSYSERVHGIPTPWHPFHEQEFAKLAEAMGKRYASDPGLVAVHVPGYWNSAEMHMPQGAWPHEPMRDAWLQRTAVLRDTFPGQAVVINHSPQPWSADVIQGAKELLGHRAWFQMNALKASTDVRWVGYTRIRDLGLAGEVIGWQFVGPSTNLQRFGGPFSEAAKKGRAGRPHYWEVYAPDLNNIP